MQIFSSSGQCCIKIPNGRRSGSAQQSFCIGYCDTNFFLSIIARPEFAEGLHDAVSR
jgi:hypothetical protein